MTHFIVIKEIEPYGEGEDKIKYTTEDGEIYIGPPGVMPGSDCVIKASEGKEEFGHYYIVQWIEVKPPAPFTDVILIVDVRPYGEGEGKMQYITDDGKTYIGPPGVSIGSDCIIKASDNKLEDGYYHIITWVDVKPSPAFTGRKADYKKPTEEG